MLGGRGRSNIAETHLLSANTAHTNHTPPYTHPFPCTHFSARAALSLVTFRPCLRGMTFSLLVSHSAASPMVWRDWGWAVQCEEDGNDEHGACFVVRVMCSIQQWWCDVCCVVERLHARGRRRGRVVGPCLVLPGRSRSRRAVKFCGRGLNSTQATTSRLPVSRGCGVCVFVGVRVLAAIEEHHSSLSYAHALLRSLPIFV